MSKKVEKVYTTELNAKELGDLLTWLENIRSAVLETDNQICKLLSKVKMHHREAVGQQLTLPLGVDG